MQLGKDHKVRQFYPSTDPVEWIAQMNQMENDKQMTKRVLYQVLIQNGISQEVLREEAGIEEDEYRELVALGVTGTERVTAPSPA